MTAARERFLAGDVGVRGIRPEVATSWYRCREQYHVDPSLCTATAKLGEHDFVLERVFGGRLVPFGRSGGRT